MYLLAYRQLGIFHENVVNKICKDCALACKPTWMKVTGEFMPRGGIVTTVEAEYQGNKKRVTRQRAISGYNVPL